MNKESNKKLPQKIAEQEEVPSWNEIFHFIKRVKSKIGWILGGIIALFSTGFVIGRFYENLMNKFEVSELKSNHAAEIQKIYSESTKEQMGEIKQTQEKIEISLKNQSEEVSRDEK